MLTGFASAVEVHVEMGNSRVLFLFWANRSRHYSISTTMSPSISSGSHSNSLHKAIRCFGEMSF